MAERELALEWLRFAKMDLSSAEYLLTHRPLPKEIICFHCQQAAEKGLKGILVNNEIVPPKIHDLEKLYAMCEEYVPNINTIGTTCNILNQYGSQPRYPEEISITENDVQEALVCAKAVLKFLEPLFPTK